MQIDFQQSDKSLVTTLDGLLIKANLQTPLPKPDNKIRENSMWPGN